MLNLTRPKITFALGLLWPVAFLVYLLYRHGLSIFVEQAPQDLILPLLVFMLTGMLSALMLCAFISSDKLAVNVGVGIGYIVMFPFAIWFGILGGLVFSHLGILIYGIAFIGAGVALGWFLGVVLSVCQARYKMLK